MQKIILIALLFTSVTHTTGAFAQPMLKKEAVEISPISMQADSLKMLFAAQGYTLLKEANVQMESGYEVPVVVPLRAGTWYRVIFIGDITSKIYEVRMFDWSERQVVFQKKMWGDVDGNIINYDYIPKFSEYHMIKPVQVNKKKKKVGGYIMLFKKTA